MHTCKRTTPVSILVESIKGAGTQTCSSGNLSSDRQMQGEPLTHKNRKDVQAAEAAAGGCRKRAIASDQPRAAGQQWAPGSRLAFQACPEAGLSGQPDAQPPGPTLAAATLA